MKNKNNKLNIRGFTVLEMIVALGVFATVATLSVSSLLSLMGAQKKALTLQSVQDNLRFSIEAIARDLRQGDFFYCGGASLENFGSGPSVEGGFPATQDCVGGRIVTFLDRENNVATYRLGDASLLNDPSDSSCGTDHLCIEKAVRVYTSGSCGATDVYCKLNEMYAKTPNFFSITSRDIEITRFDLYVTGSAKGDNNLIEPRVTLVVEGMVSIGKETSEFHLQTTVSSHRNITRD